MISTKIFMSTNHKKKLLIVFDDLIDDMVSNKKLNPRATELYIKGRMLKIVFIFIT